VLDGVLELVEVGGDVGDAVLVVLGGRDELQARLLGLAVLDLVGDGDEQARVGGALGGDANGGGDVGPRLDLLARLGGHGQVDGRVGPCAVALLAVEVLDEGGEGVEVADQDLAGVRAQVQGEHLLLVVHVDLDLLGRLGVGDGVAVADLDLSAVFAAGAEEGADDALLVGGAAQRVVEDGEDGLRGQHSFAIATLHGGCAHLRLDDHVQRGCRGLRADGRWAERAGEVEEGVGLRHDGGSCAGRAVECARPGSVRAWWWWGRNCLVPATPGAVLASTDANIYFLEVQRRGLGERTSTSPSGKTDNFDTASFRVA
jgi:hypothetical protein